VGGGGSFVLVAAVLQMANHTNVEIVFQVYNLSVSFYGQFVCPALSGIVIHISVFLFAQMFTPVVASGGKSLFKQWDGQRHPIGRNFIKSTTRTMFHVQEFRRPDKSPCIRTWKLKFRVYVSMECYITP